MPIPYPPTPAVDDTFTYGGITYTWTGVAWTYSITNTPAVVGSVAVTAPITNAGTPTAPVIGINQAALTLAQSQITNLVTDLSGKANLTGGNAFTGSQTITTLATGDKPLVINTPASPTVPLQEWQVNSSIVAKLTQPINGIPRLNLGNTDLGATFGLTVHATGGVGQIIRGVSGQTADLLTVQNNSSHNLAGFSATGRILSGGSTTTAIGSVNLGAPFATPIPQQLGVVIRESTTVGAVIRGAASQSANLTEWQNSAGTVGAKVDSNGTISTSSYLGITGTILNANVFGVLYGTGSPSTYAEGSLSTNAGFSTPVMLPNEEGYYPYWGFKTPNVVETSPDGTTWTIVNPTLYRSLFAFQNGSSISVTTRFIRITHYQPTFTFLSLVSARFVGGTNNKPITMKTELLNADYSTVNSTYGPTTGVVGYDGAALMQKFNSYNGSTAATRVTLDMALWTAGDSYQIGSLMAYMSKPGTGFGFQNKFPMLWDTNKTATFQPSQPAAKGLIVKAATTLTSTITNAVANGTTITYTTSTQHGFLAGYVISITGIVSTGNPSGTAGLGFNLTNATIATVISQNQFTITNSLVDTYTSGGTISVSQGSNLQEWQSGASSILASVNSTGTMFAPYFRVGNSIVDNSDNGATLAFNANGVNNSSIIATARSAAQVPFAVKGALTQTANLQEWQTWNGTTATTVATVNAAGLISSVRQISVNQTNAGETMMFVRGAASQTGDSFAIRDSSANTIAGFSATGRIYSGVSGTGQTFLNGLTLGAPTSTIPSQMGIVAGAATTVGAVIRGAASQSANLTEWQNSAGTILARLVSDGGLSAAYVRGSYVETASNLSSIREGQSGGMLQLVRATAAQNNPGANIARLYFRDGTTAGTLRFATITGAAGVEETIVDNISSTTSTAGARFTGAGGILTAGPISGSQGLALTGANSPVTLSASAGNGGQVLASTGAGTTPVWVDRMSNPMTTQGDIIYGGSSGTPLRLAGSATNNWVLTYDTSTNAPKWAANGGGSFTGGTLTSNLTLAAGTTSLSPLTFQSGTNLTTVTAGANEYDGTVFYQTSNTSPGRALATQNYLYVANATWSPDFTVSAAAQSILGGATTGITVAAGTTYTYECIFGIRGNYVTGPAQVPTVTITGTTVTLSPVVAHDTIFEFGTNTTSFTTATSLVMTKITAGQAMTSLTASVRCYFVRMTGVIRVTGTGTAKIYPSVAMSATSPDNGWTVQTGAKFVLTPIGNGTATTVGVWA